MLSTARISNRTICAASRGAQSRGFFDYVGATSKSSGGGEVRTSRRTDQTFSWEFLDYFRKHEPEKSAEYEKEQNKCNAAESYIGAPPPNLPKLDWTKHKSRISDPTFVDKLEVEMRATQDYWNKFTDYTQTSQWKAEGWAEESQRDYSFDRVAANEKDVQAAKVLQAEELMEKHRELLEEIKLDYEQLEAERDLFIASEETVQFNLHPQLAEQQEETYAGKQTFHDWVLGTHLYARYIKTERLAQAQNEHRRKIFLERHNHYSYLRGMHDADTL